LLNKLETTDPAQLREQFLETCAREMKGLSALEFYETTAEIRAHLTALAAAHEELGLTPVEAITTAIKNFGDPRSIGKEIQKAIEPAVSRLPLIVAIGSGAIICSAFMTAADWMLCVSGLVAPPSSGSPLAGAVIGIVLGLSLFLHRRTTAIAAIRAAVIVPSVFFFIVYLINGRIISSTFFVTGFVYYSLMSALSAAATSRFIALTGRQSSRLRRTT